MKYLVIIAFILFSTTSFSQNFSKDMADAKSSYAANKLDDAHFALLQAMQEVDIIIGKEVLALLPQKMDNIVANVKDDHVMSNTGLIGSTINRSYGLNDSIDVSIIGNSPLVSTLNTFLNTPLLGGMMSDGNNKIIKVEGYKGQLTKSTESDGQTDYTIQIPLGSALITFKAKNTTDTQITTWMNTIPLEKIAKLIQ